MRAFVAADPKLSGAMYRVAQALALWAPDEIDIVPTVELADLVVVHAIGTDVWPVIRDLETAGKQYALMQYCLRTTQEPHAAAWLPYWKRAACVWSYYNLDKALHDDGLVDQMFDGLPFYYAPLGADPEMFNERLTIGDRYLVLTSGYVAESECIAECWAAAAHLGRRVFHLGPEHEFLNLERGHVDFGLGITDDALARAYSRSDYVAGMRRCEGFEMPAAEGLLCGARPIMLDAPHYRAWFEPWAEFVPEVEPEELTEALVDMFRGDAGAFRFTTRSVTESEQAAAAERFNWERLVGEFWARVLERAT